MPITSILSHKGSFHTFLHFWELLWSLSVGVSSQPSHTSATAVQKNIRKSCYRGDSVNPVLLKKQNQNKPGLCSKQYLEWAEHTSGLSFTQAFIIVSSNNSLIFRKRVIAALRVEWTLIRHGPQCVRVKKHLVSGLWEAGGVGERGCCVWIHTEWPLLHITWEEWSNGDLLG